MTGTLPATVIVPTRNEAFNVTPLLDRLLPLHPQQVLFVDDSSDDTPQVIAAYGDERVSCLHRPPHERTGGLGGAVTTGMRAAHGAWYVVMDGDLQHPPEVVPQLLAAGARTGADVVVASRHVTGGSTGGLDGLYRQLASRAGTQVARVLFPRRLRACTDPMSGFFAVRASAVDVDRLRPDGFKILLEVLLSASRPLTVAEVGFTFADRHAGESKAALREGLLLGRRLLALRLRHP